MLTKKKYNLSEQINITVDVKNTGKREGKEVVQLYTRDHFATISPPLRKLIRYNKIVLSPGETKTVCFKVSPKDLGFYNAENIWVNEPGKHSFYLESLEATFSLK